MEENAPKRVPKKREVLIKPGQEIEEVHKVRAPKGGKKTEKDAETDKENLSETDNYNSQGKQACN